MIKYPRYYLQVWVGGPGAGSQAHPESGVQHPERGLMLHHPELWLWLGLRGHRGAWSQCIRQGQCQGYLQRISEVWTMNGSCIWLPAQLVQISNWRILCVALTLWIQDDVDIFFRPLLMSAGWCWQQDQWTPWPPSLGPQSPGAAAAASSAVRGEWGLSRIVKDH